MVWKSALKLLRTPDFGFHIEYRQFDGIWQARIASPNIDLIENLPKVSSASNRQILAAKIYTLNIDKALRKKLQSTNREIRGKLDTATFELLDSACLELY